MKHFFHLLAHEIRTLLFAPSTYVSATLFLLLMGYVFYHVMLDFANAAQEQLPLEVFFQGFALPVLFMVPLLTMKSIAEERRQGTLETLMTTPVTPLEVVLAKFFAAYLLYLFFWAVGLNFPLLTDTILKRSDLTSILVDKGVLIGGSCFVAFSGMLFIAIGIFCSSLTRTQLVAGMLCFSLLFILIVGLPAVVGFANAGVLAYLLPLEYYQIYDHLADFSRGVLDTRPLVYYVINTALVLVLAGLVVESKT